MLFRYVLNSLAGLLMISLLVLHPAGAQAQSQGQNGQEAAWKTDVERTFYLSPGLGEKLMTQDEWKSHQGRLYEMDFNEQAAYRQEWHKKLMQQARDKGIALPEVHPAHGDQAGGKADI
jgi:hypothetical protein